MYADNEQECDDIELRYVPDKVCGHNEKFRVNLFWEPEAWGIPATDWPFMALFVANDALSDDLILHITKTSPKASIPCKFFWSQSTDWLIKDSNRFHKLKSLVSRTIRRRNAGSTDHLEVAKRLNGLQEKFRVLNNDALADALLSRLEELDQIRNYWVPEVLSLLLELSDRPVTLSNPQGLDILQPPEEPPPLTWSDIYASEPDEENIWENIDYAADTSDEENVSSSSSDVSIPRIIPQRPKPPAEGFKVPESIFVSSDEGDLLASIKEAQNWRHEININNSASNYSLQISELQVIREVIFMLRGLPTSLFWQVDDSIEVDRRFRLSHASPASFGALLHAFSVIGTHTHLLRMFVKQPQSVQFLQMFQREVEICLSDFDLHLSQTQVRLFNQVDSPIVSLIGFLDTVHGQTRLLVELASLVRTLGSSSSDQPFQCLDLLYDLVCAKQASCEDHEFRRIAKVFFKCFEVYIKPIQTWIETGKLDKELGTFFIVETGKTQDLNTLWSDWFMLAGQAGRLRAPKFLHVAAGKVLTTGKSMIFLEHLGIMPQNIETNRTAKISYDDVFPSGSSPSLLPFGSLLETAFYRVLNINHELASALLRRHLGESCGLWMSLDAVEHIYFGKDISMSAVIDNRIFQLIDKRQQSWNDRYLLTDLAQDTFGQLPFVDPSSLLIRSKRLHPRDFEHQCRSVKVLRTIYIDYVLPWPVANIITKNALRVYQRVSIFLMQIRRAHFVLERSRPVRACDQIVDAETKDDTFGYAIRHHLVWFVNILYSHLTERVISKSVAEMRKSLANAKDVDGMVGVHDAFASLLDEQCLLAQNLTPIHQAVISLLDLCIHFSDIQASRYGEQRYDQFDKSIRSSARPRNSGAFTRHSTHPRESDSGTESDAASSNENSASDDGNTTIVSFLESSYRERLVGVKTKYEQLRSFTVSSLRGVSRVDGNQSWGTLAEKLEWRNERYVTS